VFHAPGAAAGEVDEGSKGRKEDHVAAAEKGGGGPNDNHSAAARVGKGRGRGLKEAPRGGRGAHKDPRTVASRGLGGGKGPNKAARGAGGRDKEPMKDPNHSTGGSGVGQSQEGRKKAECTITDEKYRYVTELLLDRLREAEAAGERGMKLGDLIDWYIKDIQSNNTEGMPTEYHTMKLHLEKLIMCDRTLVFVQEEGGETPTMKGWLPPYLRVVAVNPDNVVAREAVEGGGRPKKNHSATPQEGTEGGARISRSSEGRPQDGAQGGVKNPSGTPITVGVGAGSANHRRGGDAAAPEGLVRAVPAGGAAQLPYPALSLKDDARVNDVLGPGKDETIFATSLDGTCPFMRLSEGLGF